MPRFVEPDSGVTVSVDDEYGELLSTLGWKSADTEKKAPAKKTASKLEK